MSDMSEEGVQKSELAKREEEILAFWNAEKIFEKSLTKKAPKGEFVFYDGPPFATGLPHYGHLLQSFIKDAIPRYRTMRGYRVPRRWGWDCHGLPLENQIEQELGLKNKRAIEELGVDKFNEAARSAVMRYDHEWRKIIPRIGRWVDMENNYKTMDPTYTDSVWWSFKTLFDRGLIYEGYKAMQLCPRCGTTLSNFEVAMGYKDIEDYAVFVRFPLVGEKNTSLVIWTTTPWTLPGNMAAAVNADALYVKVKLGGEFLIVAKERVSVLGEAPEVVEEFSGKTLVGKSYEPPFSYFKDKLGKAKSKAFKVYHAPYVTMHDGTGIVHLAPAFGADDMELAKKEGIPLTHHVDLEGKFTADVSDFAGLEVKPKVDHRRTDALIVDALKKSGALFRDETITHSYPHCWRCDTPLLNYATSSWFVNVARIRNRLVSENAKVHWVPEHVGTGRFHNGLSTAPDWAISRSRYWGAPLPVWRNKKTGAMKVFGSIEELLQRVKRSGNTYFIMRHGEAKSNVEDRVDAGEDTTNHLTDTGKMDARTGAQELKKKGIDMIVTSPLIRARETASIVQKELGLPDSAVMVDERLREFKFGVYSGKTEKEWATFAPLAERFSKAPEGGETFSDTRRRMGEILFELERRYAGKKVLIISHGSPLWHMQSVAGRLSIERSIAEKEKLPGHGVPIELPFVAFPHNKNFELDYHRPYIDEVVFTDEKGEEYKRITDVFDCWYESGSMPFASNHYPRENRGRFNPTRGLLGRSRGYPADFIAESIDQTRGWFYSLVVLGTALFGRAPYKHVITNGLVLAEDGRKMSKKLKNYPDPLEVVNTYGADALRYYLLSASIMRGEDLNFSERGVDEVAKKLLMRLDNVLSFYTLYADLPAGKTGGTPRGKGSAHVLDRWILSRVAELTRDITKGFEAYELDVAARPVADFIEDLSTWYLRRSRERFKENGADKKDALATLRFVLLRVAQLTAPIMPFYAEHLFRALREEGDEISVHLTAWPTAEKVNEELISSMRHARIGVSKALEARNKAGLKVRQPLAKLTLKHEIPDALLHLVRDEVNVKEVTHDASLSEDAVLDTTLTPQLREEGLVRDYVRLVQEARKAAGLLVGDRPGVSLVAGADKAAILKKYEADLIKGANLSRISITEGAEESVQIEK